MPEFLRFLSYLIVMAGVTYLIRLLPLLFIRRKIKNRFVCSFLYYVPYSALSVMTFPAVFYSTDSLISAILGTVSAIFLAYKRKSLLTVAAGACLAVLVCELIMLAL